MGYIISQEGIAIDNNKVQAVTEWPQLQTVKEPQHVLKFANFYQCFIRNFSTIATPLTTLLKNKQKKRNEAATAVFAWMKKAFTTIPI